jgi:RNA recognition motif-containing protein
MDNVIHLPSTFRGESQSQYPPGHPFQSVRYSSSSSNTSANQQQPRQGAVFVGDLSLFCKEEHILQLFAPFGPVLTARVRCADNGVSLMHGFVVLETDEKAIAAIHLLNGQEFMGRNIK